jgi:hypothetical protein
MSTAAADALAAHMDEAEVVALLHRLNADHIRAFVDADASWYKEHLSDDFVCTLTDGRRVDKAEFLRRIAKRARTFDLTFDEIDVRPLGAVALVHGVITEYFGGGARASTRYTDVWCLRGGRWQAVAAQLTQMARG